MGKAKTKEKLEQEFAEEIDKNDSWHERIEMILLAILEEVKKPPGGPN